MITESIIIPLIGLILAALLWVVHKLGGGLREKKARILKKVTEYTADLDNKVKTDDFEDLKNLMVEIDKLYDYTLIQMNFSGNTMADRMNESMNYFTKEEFNRIWEAHKARNILVHEIDPRIKSEDIKRHYSVLKSAIYKILR